MLDLEITHGNSGGPLVNAEGEVVGINTFSISNAYGEAANYAICADEILKIDKGFDVELGDGDTFYLGSEKQKFVVRMK